MFSCGCLSRKPPRRPFLAQNLVLLCFDTVRSDSFGRRDRPGAEDAFAAWSRRAVVYDDARAPAPWTLPSVASVMTGLYPPRHDAGRFPTEIANLDMLLPSGVAPGAPTLGQAAGRAGLETIAFIANPWVDRGSGVLRGFRTIERHPTRGLLPAVHAWFALRGRSAAPFFLYVHWVDAHGDGTEAEKRREAAALSPAERRDLVASAPGGTCEAPEAYPCIRYLSYHREIELQRQDAADLLALLEKRGLLRDTLVILFSDHGEEFREHRAEERVRGADPRGYYGVGHGHALYDEILRVPLLVWSPGERARHDASPVSLVDIAPTARRRVGLPPGRRLDGRPLPLGGPSPSDRALFASSIGYGPEQAAVIEGARKEIAITCPEEALLFDLRGDPAEKRPAAGPAADPALAASLARYLGQRRGEVVPMTMPSQRMKALRSLGYLRGSAGRRGPPSDRLGPTTIGLFDPKTGSFHLRYSNTPGPPDRTVGFGRSGDLPVVGDWDGNGTTDLGVFRPSERAFHLASRDGGVRTIPVAGAGAAHGIPVSGDWVGDGVETVGVYDPDRGAVEWTAADSASAGHPVAGGEKSDVPVPGKWGCRGRTELAFFRSGDAAFRFPEPGAVRGDVRFGAPGDVPIAGDWDGNGTTTIGVYRPATSTFLLRNSVTPGPPDLAIRFGRSGIPVVGRWDRSAADTASRTTPEIRPRSSGD